MTNDVEISETMAAQLCGVSMNTMNVWRKQDNPPPRNEQTKKYPVAELGQWMVKELVLKPGQGGSYPWMPDVSRFPNTSIKTNNLPGLDGSETTIATKEQEETRLKRAQADKAELDLVERAGDLVKVEDVNSAWVDITTRVKAKLTRIPSALAQLAHGKSTVAEVQDVLDSGVREALEELSEDWRDAIEVNDGG